MINRRLLYLLLFGVVLQCNISSAGFSSNIQVIRIMHHVPHSNKKVIAFAVAGIVACAALVTRFLIKRHGDNLLLRAADKGQVGLVKFLRLAGAEINGERKHRLNNSLYGAIRHHELDRIKAFIAAGANVNYRDSARGDFLLHTASGIGQKDVRLKVVQALLNSGSINVNVSDSDKMTPLHRAVLESDCKVVQVLIAAGANVNQQDVWGKIPLHYAVEVGDLDMVQKLIAVGSNVEHRAMYGYTPFLEAVIFHHIPIVEYFMRNFNVDVNMRDEDGNTPLHQAAINSWLHNDHLEIIRILLAAGADVNKKNNRGQKALEVASYSDRLPTVQQLLATNS